MGINENRRPHLSRAEGCSLRGYRIERQLKTRGWGPPGDHEELQSGHHKTPTQRSKVSIDRYSANTTKQGTREKGPWPDIGRVVLCRSYFRDTALPVVPKSANNTTHAREQHCGLKRNRCLRSVACWTPAVPALRGRGYTAQNITNEILVLLRQCYLQT